MLGNATQAAVSSQLRIPSLTPSQLIPTDSKNRNPQRRKRLRVLVFGSAPTLTTGSPGHPPTKHQRYQQVVANRLVRIPDGCSAEPVLLGQL